jgi:hypothetical protein
MKTLATLTKKGFKVARSLPLPDPDATLRPLPEIAARLTALRLLFMWPTTTAAVISDAEIRAALRAPALKRALTPEERKILALPRKKAMAAHQGTIGWRLENMLPLAWILGLSPAPRADGSMIGDKQIEALITFIRWKDGVDALLTRARPRSLAEVVALEDLFYAAHNAARSSQLGGNTVPDDFHPVVNGGVIHERRHALTWALSPGVKWDATDLST